MVKTVLISLLGLLLLVVVVLLAYAATRPDQFRVQRSVRIQAPPAKVFALIEDLHRFNTWNPYNRKDPNIQGRYEGPASGPGARYAFEGNREVGKGSVRIVSIAAPQLVTMQLDMIEPMAGSNAIEFTLQPQGDNATEVTWAMHGASPYLAKLAGVVFNMDRMIGRDFEAGLAQLKVLAEAAG